MEPQPDRQINESRLVARAAEGDCSAVQQLLIRHHDRLEGIIRAKIPADLRSVLAADDVCQDAYVSVFQQISTLRDRSAKTFGRWVEAIAERKLIDAIRAHRADKRGGGRHQVTPDGWCDASSAVDLLQLVAVHEQTPSRSVARHELVSSVSEALEGLKDDYRMALRLHHIEGLSVAETAERMGRSSGAVVMLCQRALKQLAEAVGDQTRFFSRGA